MSYLFLVARKLLFKRKSSLLTASLAVAATIFLITFNGVVFEGVFNAVERDLVSFQYGNVVIRNEKEQFLDTADYQIINQITRHPLVEAAAPRIQTSATEVKYKALDGKYSVYKVFVIGIDPRLEPKVSQIFNSLTTGKPKISPETALVGKDLAQNLRLDDPDGRVEVKFSRGDLEFSRWLKVSGIVSSPVTGGLNELLIVHIDLLRDILNVEKISTSIIVKLSQDERAEEVIDWIKPKYPDYEVLTANEAAGWLEQAGATTSFINLVGYAGMIASALAVITVLTMIVSGKTRDIGVLRSIGISKKGIILIFILDGILIGLIGSTIGALASSSIVLLLENFPIAFFGGIILEVSFGFKLDLI
ncbi:MAG: FtsX-like permease family protein, partial [Candidatus Methylarchaceae archaeon HK01M]|nr:FtsX-like permease family protein [Candidatus Methylarchaceae archaeon HK01M]